VLPVKRGMLAAKIQIMLYAAGFVAQTRCSRSNGYVGYIYLIVMTAVGIGWLR